MGYGTTLGVSPSRAIMFVTGTAPFVFDGTLLSNTTGGTVKYVTPQVSYSSMNKIPSNPILGLDDFIYSIAPQKHSRSNFSNQTMFFKLGLLVLPQNGRQAVIKLHACQGYQLSPGNKTAPYGAQNYCCEIFVYSGNAGNTSGPSLLYTLAPIRQVKRTADASTMGLLPITLDRQDRIMYI